VGIDNPVICGWIRRYGKLPTGEIAGICALSSSYGLKGARNNQHECKGPLPMKSHEDCPMYEFFMRTNENPNRYSFFVYGRDGDRYKMRFNWLDREVAASISLRGKRVLSLGES
jgi:hypothetical protein